ncbi:MAG TPA: hypothetical protein ENH01_02320 [Nitrospirae bacterium]|nr:hypothetical protein [Nitrospirota bacterium]
MKINEVNTWGGKLGLLPVPLFDNQTSKEKYVLLNGNFGNFCLDLSGEQETLMLRNYAWSSDVGHYVNIINNAVEIYRWDKRASSLERYSRKSVENNLEKFYQYLQKDQPRRDISIIPFTINIFRRLRGAFDPSVDGPNSLKAFLYLLACTSDGVSRNKLDVSKWRLDSKAKDVASAIRSGDWQRLLDELIEGLPLYGLKPDISLLLRHATGRLFQEAHYIATVENINQIALPGFLSKKVSISKKTDSIGVYYTPSPIVRTLVEEVLASIGDLPSSLTVFDPACGSGEFLKEILRQLSLLQYRGKITLTGWDISQPAVDISNFVLARETTFWKSNISIEISLKDALQDNAHWPQNVDIILMNPPFRSWQDMDTDMRETFRNTFAHLLEKRPDLASIFIWNAAHSLKSKGILGTILPASILDADSYIKFRREFAAVMTPLLIGKLGSQSLFANALVDAAIYVGQASKRADISAIALWADHKQESASAALRALRQHRGTKNRKYTPIDEPGFSIYPNSLIGKSDESWAARSYRSYQLFNKLKHFSCVKDLFNVQQGARTGLKPAFILSKAAVGSLPPKEQIFFRPAVINESIKHGCLNDSAYVFYPYGENIPKIDTEDDLKKYLTVYYKDYLLSHREKLLHRARKGESNWWKLSEHRAWQRKKFPKLVSTFFGKAGSFAWDDTGHFVVVQGHHWKPKATKHEEVFSREVGLAYLAILCSSPLIDSLLSYVSNHLGGGQWDLSKKCIKNMPLPDLFSKSINTELFGRLVEIGNLIKHGKTYEKDSLYQMTLHFYGLPENTSLFG